MIELEVSSWEMSPRLTPGDTCTIDKNANIGQGDICLILFKDNNYLMICRVFRFDNGCLNLAFENPSVRTMYLTPDEILNRGIKIIGKIIEVRHTFGVEPL